MSRRDQFYATCPPGNPDECWLWPHPVGTHGYGTWSEPENPARTASTTAPRCAFFYANGYWPYVVRHRCPGGPNRKCVNPSHLLDGNHGLNAKDRAEDGHELIGENIPIAKLTDELVAEARRLRRAGMELQQLAEKYDVSRATIASAVFGETWIHVAEPPCSRISDGRRHAKLTADEVKEVRALLAEGVKGTTIAARYGVSNVTISDIKTGRSWGVL